MITDTMKEALVQLHVNGEFGHVRKSTITGLERRELIQQTDNGYSLTSKGKQYVSESQSDPRPNRLMLRWNMPTLIPTYDIGQADYAFWDRARRGRARGLGLGGLFIKPLASKIASWALGQLPKIRSDNSIVQDLVSDWVRTHHAKLIEAYEEACALGDCYVLVNADLSLTILPPQVVMPILAKDDYSRVIGYRVTEVYQNPYTFSKMTIQNDYTATERVRTVSVDADGVENGVYKRQTNTIKTQTFRNLTGKIPIIPIAYDAGADERYGHPVAEALLHALNRYDDVFEYAIAGNKRQGRPTPVISKMGDVDQIDKFWALFGKTEKYVDAEGKEQTQNVLDFDADQVLTLGGDAEFDWKAPGSFTSDTQNLLELLFYLILQHSEIPEFVWGNAIASSKASAESQMPPFVRFIEKKQGQITRWLGAVLEVVVAIIRTYETGIREDDKVTIGWMPLTNADGALTLQAVQLGLDRGLIDTETALKLMPLDIEKPSEVLMKAKAEEAERAEEYDRRQEALIMGRRRDEDMDASEEDNPNEEMADE